MLAALQESVASFRRLHRTASDSSCVYWHWTRRNTVRHETFTRTIHPTTSDYAPVTACERARCRDASWGTVKAERGRSGRRLDRTSSLTVHSCTSVNFRSCCGSRICSLSVLRNFLRFSLYVVTMWNLLTIERSDRSLSLAPRRWDLSYACQFLIHDSIGVFPPHVGKIVAPLLSEEYFFVMHNVFPSRWLCCNRWRDVE